MVGRLQVDCTLTCCGYGVVDTGGRLRWFPDYVAAAAIVAYFSMEITDGVADGVAVGDSPATPLAQVMTRSLRDLPRANPSEPID